MEIKHSAHSGNDKQPSPLKSLKADLDIYNDSIREVSDEMLDAMLTGYPIFVAHQHEVKLGEIILDHRELGRQWTIQASTLEEFIEKKVILPERREFFEKKYKDPRRYMCLFVIVPEGANFVFHPYK